MTQITKSQIAFLISHVFKKFGLSIVVASVITIAGIAPILVEFYDFEKSCQIYHEQLLNLKNCQTHTYERTKNNKTKYNSTLEAYIEASVETALQGYSDKWTSRITPCGQEKQNAEQSMFYFCRGASSRESNAIDRATIVFLIAFPSIFFGSLFWDFWKWLKS